MTDRAAAPAGLPLAPIVVAGLVMIVWGATPVMTKLATAEMPPLVVAAEAARAEEVGGRRPQRKRPSDCDPARGCGAHPPP